MKTRKPSSVISKSGLGLFGKSALIATGVALSSTMFSAANAGVLSPRTPDLFSENEGNRASRLNYFFTEDAGSINVEVSLDEEVGTGTGDIGGIWFNIADDSGINTTDLTFTSPLITDTQFGEKSFGKKAELDDSYSIFDVGLKISNPNDISNGDEIKTVTFTIDHKDPNKNLDLSLFSEQMWATSLRQVEHTNKGTRGGNIRHSGTTPVYVAATPDTSSDSNSQANTNTDTSSDTDSQANTNTGTDNAGLKSAPFETQEINQYLIIGTGDDQVGDAINFQNIEAGANTKMKAGDPNDVTNSTKVISDDDPNLVDVFEARWDTEKGVLNNGENAPLYEGIDNSGTAAVTSETGKFSYSNSTAYTDTDFAVRCASDRGNGTGECQNNDTNDSRWRTSDPTISDTVNSNTLNNQPTRYKDQITDNGMIDRDEGGEGVVGNYNHDNLIGELEDAWTYINGLDNLVEYTITDEELKNDDKPSWGNVLNLDALDTNNDGIAIIDIDVKNQAKDDFKLNNYDWVLDGDGSTFAIFRVRGDSNMLMSNSSITLGTGGIGDSNKDGIVDSLGAIFVQYEEPTENTDQVFNFNNVLLNGVGFWDLNAFRNGQYDDSVGTELTIQNGQGCSQFISSKHDFDNGRYTHCAAAAAYKDLTAKPPRARVPEPSSIAALAFIGGGMFLTRRRQSH